MKKYIQSYIPFLAFFCVGIVFHDLWKVWIALAGLFSLVIMLLQPRIGFYVVSLVGLLFLGTSLYHFRDLEFRSSQFDVSKYNHQKLRIEGAVDSFPVPSNHDVSYVIKTTSIGSALESRDILIHSRNETDLHRGDHISQETFLYVQKNPNNTQKIRKIDLYGIVKPNDRVEVLQINHQIANILRERIFSSAKKYLSPKIYSYFRVMVFGDQALLDPDLLIRLKETGLLHLFVISGTHITCILFLGFWIFRILIGWIPNLHRQKMTFVWIDSGAVLFVFLFLQLINPPVSTFRAVASMALFVILKVFNRRQSALWNLGIVFFGLLITNPLYLFDVSTQLTFSSVFGILSANSILQKFILSQRNETGGFLEKGLKAVATTVGACVCTAPVLFCHFGSFYAQSFLYNLVVVPTIGELLSFVSVASVVWALIPIGWVQWIGFNLLEMLFRIFEKMLFWKPEIKLYTLQNWLSTYSQSTFILAGFLSGVLAILLFYRNRKQMIRP